jgi:hypothetical protein
MNLYIEYKQCNGDIRTFYKKCIEKYEDEVKGYSIMIHQQELSQHSNHAKKYNIDILKNNLRKAKYKLTRTKTLLKNYDDQQN